MTSGTTRRTPASVSRAKQAASAAAAASESGGVSRVLTAPARGALTITMQTGRGMVDCGAADFGLRINRSSDTTYQSAIRNPPLRNLEYRTVAYYEEDDLGRFSEGGKHLPD